MSLSLFPIERLPHLVIPQAPNTPERRPAKGGGNAVLPQGGDRVQVAQNFEVAVNRLQQQQADIAAKQPVGIQPHLVFRLPLLEKVNLADLEAKLDRVGLSVISVEPDKSAVVAFRSDDDLEEFRSAIDVYKTPNAGSKSTVYDVLEWIDADHMRAWQPEDRIGAKLAEDIGADGERIEDNKLYQALDVELWMPELNAQSAQKNLEQIRALVAKNAKKGEFILDTYAGSTLCLARVRVTGAKLRQLVNLTLIAGIELPAQPAINPAQVWQETVENLDFPREPVDPDGPRLCVLDSGITSGHPLLAQNVGFEAAFPSRMTPADANGHGTRVAGIALYGDVREYYDNKRFQSPIILYSGRILNDANQLDDEKLFINQIKEALDTFTKPPYSCRIYNLSFGRYDPWDVGKQTVWGEALDALSREYQVLFVVSAGNYYFLTTTDGQGRAEDQLARYHQCLLEDDWRLCDPATSALALTVGSIAEADVPTLNDDLKIAVAKKNQPSPFSRTGAGVMKAVKPDFVANGGNLVWEGAGRMRRIHHDPAVSVMSLHYQPAQRQFAFDFGTSMAAPRVAHIAALVEWQLWQDLGERPHPNLVRAVTATAATIPPECRTLFDSDDVHRVCGYGRINPQNAVTSGPRRALLCAASEIEINHIAIFRVPITAEFAEAQSEKRITIALAFDPPVRARRNDYLGVEMEFRLVRGKSLAEVEDAYRKFSEQERKAGAEQEALPNKFVAKLTPSATMKNAGVSRKHSTLQCAYWKGKLINAEYCQHEEWYVVVQARNKWAKAEIDKQDFAIAVVVEAENDELYARIKERVQVRPRIQIRS